LEYRVAPDLLSNTIIWPLLLGAVLAGLLIVLGPRDYLLGAIAAVMIFAVYVLLEGLPAFPPISAKHKLGLLLPVTALVVLAAVRFRLALTPVILGILAAAFVWLGWNRLFTAAAWPQSASIVILISAATLASRQVEKHPGDAFLWPGAFLCFTIGGAILSLLGLFVGFAQALGAFAAWLGGFLLIRYAALLVGRGNTSLPPDALQIMLVSAVLVSLMIGLFAPGISHIALIVLSGCLIIPVFTPRFAGVPSWIKPFLSGLIAAVPAALSVLIAFQLKG
jgi:hypothetical protein